MSDVLDSFIGAQNFCTGSQTDFSTCIANNMRFSKYLDDTYEATSTVNVRINDAAIPHVYGKSYVPLKPVAIANVLTRVMETNSYGAIKFRCLDVYSQPRLPLPSLQDLGIAKSNLLDIVELPEIPESGPSDTPTYEDIPVFDDNKLNVLNFIIGFSTSVSKTLTMSREIRSIINQHLNYYDLPNKAVIGLLELERAALLLDKAIQYVDLVLTNPTGPGTVPIYSLLKQLLESVRGNGNGHIGSYDDIYNKYKSDVHDPLVNSIDDNTDFSTYDFTITKGVAEDIGELEKDDYPKFLATSLYLKYVADLDRTDYLTHKIVSTYSGLVLDIYPGFFTTLSTFYSSYYEQNIFKLRNSIMLHELLVVSRNIWYDLALQELDPNDDKHDEYVEVIEGFDTVISMFDHDDIVDRLTENIEDNNTELDEYYTNIGYEIKIETSKLADSIHDLYNQPATGLTEIKFGTDYKDSGKFYYADLAYAVGLTKIERIHSIKIDEEYYTFEEEDGTKGVAISEAGCTKYTFTRHVLPTYDYKVEMYIYPGVAGQPYCPTINTYHNFAASSYSGMFTKVENDMVGLYVYQNYRPMHATVERITKMGEVNFNSINLNDPSLDPKSYETMMMKEVKNLTNATSINGEPISTDDLKYYTSSSIVDETKANNYPTMGIIEFKRFPLKSSLNFPKITILIEATDIIARS